MAFLAVVGFMLGALMLFGNGLTIMAVIRTPKLRTRSNMYIVSLAATDALVGVLVCVVGTYSISSVRPVFDSKELLCVGTFAWGYCTVVCSGINMCLIALDRYVYIVKPFFYELFMTERNIAVAIVIAWVTAFTYGTIPIYYNTFDTAEHCLIALVIPKTFRSFATTGTFAFCCVFTGAIYMHISILTLRHKRQIARRVPAADAQSSEQPRGLRATRSSLKALKLFVLVFGCLFLCWSPYFIMNFVRVFDGGEVEKVVYQSLLLLGFSNSGVNMFIYPYFNKDFRAAMKTLLCCGNKSQNMIHVRSGVTELTSNRQ